MNASRKDTKDSKSIPALQFVEPMYALAIQNIPEGEEWLYEVKLTATAAWLEETKAE